MPKTKTKARNKLNKTSRKNISLQKRLLQKLTPTRKSMAIITVVLFGAVGAILYIQSQAGTCGARKDNYTYKVPWGKAVWNQPVCNLPRHSQSTDYVNRLLEWGHLNNGDPVYDANNGKISTDPGFPAAPAFNNPDGLGNLFTTEVYYASKATMFNKKVASLANPSNLDGAKWQPFGAPAKDGYTSILPASTIPWNNDWKTSKGGDNQMIIIDDRVGSSTYGAIWSFWGNENSCPIFYADRACARSIQVARDHYGNLVNHWTYEGYTGDRGVGLSYYATLTTADEVKAGEIRHALGISIPNTGAGPICTAEQLKEPVNWNIVGKQCGTAVAPASKFEWGGSPSVDVMPEEFKKIYTVDKLIPEGMRFALNVTDQQITDWINSRADLKSNPRRAETARIFAVALRDYGMMIVDTNAGRPSVQTEGGINPESATKWKSVAMGPENKDNLLDGLITKQNLYVVEPPTLTCPDENKTSKFYCKWTKAVYSQDTGVTTTSENTAQQLIPPTITITSPVANATAIGPVDIAASVSGQNPITNVQFTVAGTPLATDPTAPYTYRFDSKALKNGINTIAVKAIDSKGLSTTKTVNINVNNPLVTTQTDTTPPTPPATLARSLRPDITKARYVLDLTWKASTDASGIKEYQVTRNGGKTPFAKVTKETKLTDDTVEAGVQYSYSVVAVDNAGKRSLPSSVSAKGNCFLIWCSLE